MNCSILIFLLVGVSMLSQSEGYIPMGDETDFPMGMRYDEEFNIRKIKPKKPLRKTIESFRLPKAITPVHYELEMRPIMEQPPEGSRDQIYTCPGKVTILVHIVEPTNSVTLHSKKITVDSINVRVVNANNDTDAVVVTGHNVDEERAFYTIFLDKDLSLNQEYQITIPFVAPIPSPDVLQAGLYRTYYMGSDGTTQTGAMTQFQKDDASRAFPCFDEPNLKAEYTIKIGRLEKDWLTFCNMDRVGEPVPIEGMPGWVWDNYGRTVKMSVYLVAFAIMKDYAVEVTPPELYRLPVKTWIPKALWTNTSAKFSASASGRMLTFFEGLFDVPFYLNKMENLGVENMDLLAMEHPGLVTYRTNILAWHKEKDTQWDLFNQASLIAHEYAHQWFGNLVTCKWWNDFWLNEAFSRYFQFVGADKAGLNFKALDRFVIDVTQWAMEFDEGTETVPIRNDETDKVFYQPFHIEYEKGAAIVRMIRTMLTGKTFINGLRRYFKRHMWQSVGPEDLYRALTEQANEDHTISKYTVAQIMKPWLTKTGYPILQVSKADNNRVFISQQRFILHPAANDKIEPGLWYIPVWYVTKTYPKFDGDNTPPNFWMDKETLTTYLHVNSTDDWIIVNPQGRGYYRVVYDRTLTTLIAKQLNEDHNIFDAATRSQLFDDYFRSAKARYITLGHAMILTTYLHKEDDIVVWTTIFNNYRRVYQKLIDTPIIEPFKQYLLRHLRPAVQRLGMSQPADSPPYMIMLHSMFIDWICTLEDDICNDLVKEYMNKWLQNPAVNPIPVDIQSFVYCAGVAFDTEKKVKPFFKERLQTERNPRQKNMLVRALTCCKDEEYLAELVDNTINSTYGDINMDVYGSFVLWHVVRNSLGRNIVWQFVKTKQKEIVEKMGPMAIANVIEAVSPYMSNRGISNLNYEFILFIQSYLRNNKDTLSKKVQDSLTKAAERIVDNSLWMDFFYSDLKEFLQKAKLVQVF